MKKLISLTKNIDQFDRPVSFSIENLRTHKTYLGAFLSIVIFVFLLYTFLREVFIMVDGNSPRIF
jgi:hypothetical protein